MAMPISVIIPTLNEERTITTTLAHTATPLGFDELIVVDGGSTDTTSAHLGTIPAQYTVLGPQSCLLGNRSSRTRPADE